MSISIDLLKKMSRDGSVRIEEVEAIEIILERSRRCRQQLQEETDRHKKAVAQIDRKLLDVQSTCPHIATTYFPDASGNNDSSTICDICGAEVRKQDSGKVMLT